MKSFLVQPFHQRISVTRDAKAFTARYNRNAPDAEQMDVQELDGCDGMAAHLAKKGMPALFMMYLTPDCHDDVLYHESLHMAHYIMDFAGAPINLDSTETQAYLMTHIAATARKKVGP